MKFTNLGIIEPAHLPDNFPIPIDISEDEINAKLEQFDVIINNGEAIINECENWNEWANTAIVQLPKNITTIKEETPIIARHIIVQLSVKVLPIGNLVFGMPIDEQIRTVSGLIKDFGVMI
uniref:Uncharacterized protein n=1 Tax=Meloidogyne incognita TaxID=6306 RepID=A0A914L8B2_MELIC